MILAISGIPPAEASARHGAMPAQHALPAWLDPNSIGEARRGSNNEAPR